MNNKILVIDDEKEAMELVKARLAGLPCVIDTLQEATNAVRKAAEFQPGLIILDILMPEINGIEVLQNLAADSRTKDIPVMILTSCDNDKVKEKALGLGARYYLGKPVDRDFASLVKDILHG